jgi:DNA-binding NarL/FixJ family response regulator
LRADADPADSQPTVLIVDDHALFRRGLRELLEAHGFLVLGEASNGRAALQLVEATHPDVVLMDLSMPGMGGVEATRKLSRSAPGTRVLVLTTSVAEDDLLDALLAGAVGYLLKEAGSTEIAGGLRAAARGDATFSPLIAARLAARVREWAAGSDPPVDAGNAPDLTDRELEVLKLVARGDENAEIGRELHLSPSTVKNHVSAILDKLGLDNRVQAAVWAAQRGLV